MAKQQTTTLFRFEAADLPEIERFFDENMQDPMKAAATHAFADVAALAQKRLRNQVRTRFRDRMTKQSPFEKSFKAWAYPKAPDISMRPAVTVQANPVWAEIFEEGRPKTVRPAVKRFLAIPTEEAEKRGLDKVGTGRGWNRRLTVSVLNPGIGLLAPGFSKYGLLSVELDGQPPKLMFRGVLNSMPVDIEEAMVTLEFFAQPDDQDDKLEAYAKSLSVRPYVEPLISGNSYRDPATALIARSATYYIDPITHEFSLNDMLDWSRVIDIGPWHERDRFTMAVLAPPLGSVTVTAIAEWTQEAKGTVDIANAVNAAAGGVGGLKSLTQLESLADSFDIQDEDGQSGWSVTNVEHTGLHPAETVQKFKTGIYERVLLQKQTGWTSIGNPIFHNWIDTRWQVSSLSIYTFFAKSFEMAYKYSQPRREVLQATVKADIQDIAMFGWTEEAVDDISLDSLVSDPAEPWMENTDYFVGDRVVKKDRSWICQEDHNSGYDAFQKILPQFESIPKDSYRTPDMYRWKWVPKDAPLKDKRSSTFVNTPRGREVAAHLVLRARALLRKRMRCLEATINGEWERLSDVTLKDAIRLQHDYFQTENNEVIGKVIAYTKTWDARTGTYEVAVTIGISTGNGYADLPEIDNGVGYSQAFAGYAYPVDADITSQVSDVQFTLGGDPIKSPVDPYRLKSAGYACHSVRYDMAADKQLPLAARAEAMGRSPLKAVEENPTTFEIRMRAIDGLDLITRKVTISSTTVQGPSRLITRGIVRDRLVTGWWL